jgi:hypothetical protein
MESKNPIQIAARIGQSLAWNIRELALIDLELAYATRLLLCALWGDVIVFNVKY